MNIYYIFNDDYDFLKYGGVHSYVCVQLREHVFLKNKILNKQVFPKYLSDSYRIEKKIDKSPARILQLINKSIYEWYIKLKEKLVEPYILLGKENFENITTSGSFTGGLTNVIMGWDLAADSDANIIKSTYYPTIELEMK